MKQKTKTIFNILLLLLFLIALNSCNSPPAPQESCFFSQNSYKQRVSVHHPPLRFYIHPSIPTKYHDSIRSEAERWNNFHETPIFEIASSLASAPDDLSTDQYITPNRDHYSILSMKRVASSFKPGEQANTTTYITGDEIQEADILFNGTLKFSIQDSPPIEKIHFPSLTLHEFGHSKGLNHSKGVMSPTLPRGTVRHIGSRILDSLKCEYTLRE